MNRVVPQKPIKVVFYRADIREMENRSALKQNWKSRLFAEEMENSDIAESGILWFIIKSLYNTCQH